MSNAAHRSRTVRTEYMSASDAAVRQSLVHLWGDCFCQMVGTNTILQWADETLGSNTNEAWGHRHEGRQECRLLA